MQCCGQVFTMLFCFVTLTILGCGRQHDSKWIDIGMGPDRGEIEYRIISFKNDKDELVKKTHSDLAQLTMDAQSGRARDKWVYMPLDLCFAPSLRDGMPSVLCRSISTSIVIVTAPDNVREALMNLNRIGKVAAVKGRIIGVHADLPIIMVDDPNVKLPD